MNRSTDALIYAPAAAAYHLLTGSQLFPHSNPAVVISRHLNVPPPSLAARRAELARLDPVLAAALAKNPADRFPRCMDFAQAFTETAVPQGEGPTVAPTTPAPAARSRSAPATIQSARAQVGAHAERGAPRRRWLIPAAALAVAVLIAAIALAWRPG